MLLPNHTQISNEFIDIRMFDYNGAEVKVYLAISRKTIGWHKVSDFISYDQLQEMTGLCNQAIKTAVDSLVKEGLIEVFKEKGKTNRYDLKFDTSLQIREVLSTNQRGTSLQIRDTKERKETIQKKDVLSSEYPPEFEDWWELYPRKTQKQAAYTKYKATKNKGATLEMLRMAAICYRKRCEKDETDQKYILHPKTFLGPDAHWLEWYNNAEQIRRAEVTLRVPTPKKEQPELTPGEQKKNQEAVVEMMEKLNVKFGVRRVR